MLAASGPSTSSIPSSLDQLPNELLIGVLSYIDGPRNLANICVVLPRCRQLAEPFFRQYLASYYFTGLDSLKNFVGFMLQHQYLREYVVQVDFEDCGHLINAVEDWWTTDGRDYQVFKPEILAVLRKAAFPEWSCSDHGRSAYEVVRKLEDTPGPEERYAGWSDDRLRRDALIAILLILLPNVRHMHIESWHCEHFITHLFHEAMACLGKANEDDMAFLRHAVAQEVPLEFSLHGILIPSHCVALLHLTQLSLFYSEHSNGEGASSIAQIIPYFYLPCLVRLDGYIIITCDDEDEDDKMHDVEISRDRRYGLSETPQKMSSVTNLNFCNCAISIDQLEMAIQIPKVLKSFHYSYGGFALLTDQLRPMWDEEAFDGTRLNEIILRHAKTTLVSLSLHADPWEFPDSSHGFDVTPSDSSASMGPLREYELLKHLSVPLVLLLGRADEERAFRLTEMLPATLESLCIYCCFYQASAAVWQPQEYFPHVLELLSQKAALVPNLKLLKIWALGWKDFERVGDQNLHKETPQKAFIARNPVYAKLQDACNAADVELTFFEADADEVNVQELAIPHVD